MHGIRKFSGFTLIELMVSLTIVIILTLVSVALFSSLRQSVNASAAADTLNEKLLYARSEAVKNNTTIYVSFVTGSNWCYGINSGSACTCSTSGSCGLGVVSATTATQTTLSTAGLTGNSISFEPTHGAANASGSMTFTVYGQSSLVTVMVSRLGNIQMCSTGIGGYTAC